MYKHKKTISAKALSPYFVQQNIISPSEQLEIFDAASPNKRACLLLSNVSSALKAGINKVFYQFLDITEQHGNIDSISVTNNIRKKLTKLKCKDEGTYSVCLYVCSWPHVECTYVCTVDIQYACG